MSNAQNATCHSGADVGDGRVPRSVHAECRRGRSGEKNAFEPKIHQAGAFVQRFAHHSQQQGRSRD
jgi:hypothetical protein